MNHNGEFQAHQPVNHALRNGISGEQRPQVQTLRAVERYQEHHAGGVRADNTKATRRSLDTYLRMLDERGDIDGNE